MVAEKFRNWAGANKYPLGTAVVVLLFFAFFELLKPYYFLEGENRAIFLPNMVFAFESLLNGQLPLVNYHQFMGVPFLASGAWCALNPLTYLAVFLSLFATGGYFASVDIYIVLNLIIGAVGMYYFLRRICRLPDYTAFFGATAWPVTGFMVFFGSSCGAQFASAGAWFPWLVFAAGRLIDRPAYSAMLWLVAARLAVAYFAEPVFALYAVLCEIVFALFYAYRADIRMSPSLFKAGMWQYVLSLFFGCALALPLWLPMLQYAVSSPNLAAGLFAEGANNPVLWLWGLFVPFSTDIFSSGIMARAARLCAAAPAAFLCALPFLSFAGYGVLVGAVGLVRDLDRTRHEVWLKPVLGAFAAVLLLSFGPLDKLFGFLPFFKGAHHGFKMVLFADAFLIAAASLGILHIARRVSYRFGKVEMRQVVFYACAANLGLSFLIFTALPARGGFRTAEAVPLFEPLRNKITEGRFVSFASPAGIADGFTQHLIGFNYATLWGLNGAAGSQFARPAHMGLMPLFSGSGLVLDGELHPAETVYALKRAGVRWFIVNRQDVPRYKDIIDRASAVLRHEDVRRLVYEMPGSVPLAFAVADGAGAVTLAPQIIAAEKVVPLPAVFSAHGVKVRAELPASAVVAVNVSPLPGYRVYVDGKRAELADGPAYFPAVFVPAGRHEISFRYTEPWLWLGLLIALAGVVGLWIMSAERFSVRPLRERFNMRRFARRQNVDGGSPRRKRFTRGPLFKRRRKK